MLTQFSNHRNLFLNKFLHVIVIILFSVHAKAIFLLTTFEPPQIGYYESVLRRFYNWYSQTYFNFEKNLSTDESKLVQLLIADINTTNIFIDPRTEMPRFRISIDLDKNKLTFGNLYISFYKISFEQKKLLEKILKNRKIYFSRSESTNKILAIEWAFDKDQFSIFFLNSKETIEQIVYEKSEKINSYIWSKVSTRSEGESYIFATGVSKNWKITSGDSIKNYIETTMFPSKNYSELIEAPIKKISNEFGFYPQAILFEKNNRFRIYYQ